MNASVPLEGSAFHSEEHLRRGHRRAAALSKAESRADTSLTLLLREDPRGPSLAHTLAWLEAQPPLQRRHLDTRQLAAEHGFAEQDAAVVARWAAAAGLEVGAVDPASRRIVVRGEAVQLGRAFGVALERFSGPDPDGHLVEYRGYAGSLRLPADLDGVVHGVFGLDNRPLARSHLRHAEGRATLVSYDPNELAEVYAFPRLPNGGADVHLVAGMIELGGIARAADVAESFERLGLQPPEIMDVSVDGALPRSDPDGADVEVALDYQVLGAMVMQMAPRARLRIVVYNAPNDERGFFDAVATAATDSLHRPAAVSISWGAPENGWTLQGMRAMNAAFAAGAARGVVFSASAGDWGSTSAEADRLQHAMHPASSPHVWACGGTTLLAARGRIVSEAVWNELSVGEGAAGSGVSAVFTTPDYQAANGIVPRSANDGRRGRGLPDGSANADPVTGWNVLSAGRLRTTGGTSAVAPMYTALWTLAAALHRRPVGQPHALLYANGHHCFNDVTRGDTGGPYAARRGWDLATGWGSPIGVRIARGLDRGLARRPLVSRRRESRRAREAALV
jgi:kumamolisin